MADKDAFVRLRSHRGGFLDQIPVSVHLGHSSMAPDPVTDNRIIQRGLVSDCICCSSHRWRATWDRLPLGILMALRHRLSRSMLPWFQLPFPPDPPLSILLLAASWVREYEGVQYSAWRILLPSSPIESPAGSPSRTSSSMASMKVDNMADWLLGRRAAPGEPPCTIAPGIIGSAHHAKRCHAPRSLMFDELRGTEREAETQSRYCSSRSLKNSDSAAITRSTIRSARSPRSKARLKRWILKPKRAAPSS